MADNAAYITVTDDSFSKEVLQSPLPVLVDFWAAWCGPCRVIAPVIEELASEYEGRVKVAKIDVDNNPHTPMQYGVRSIPTLLLFDGGQVRDQMIGAVPKRQLAKRMDALVPNVI